MRRWLPYPLLAAILFLLWLLLTQSFSVGQFLLGAAVAVLATNVAARLRPETAPLAKPGAIAKLAFLVLTDIVRSNFAVASVILGRRRDRVSGFVRFPLELQSRNGLAVLALIITATPGTFWVEFDRAQNILLIHVLDLVDEATWIEQIKGRYESLLLEIFGR